MDMTALPRPKGEKLLTHERGDLKVGDLHTDRYGHSQFSGSWTYKVTRIDGMNVYGVYHSGDVYEMDIEDVM